MTWLSNVTFDQLLLTAVVCLSLREAMILFLPDRIAGPGGWLVDVRYQDDAG